MDEKGLEDKTYFRHTKYQKEYPRGLAGSKPSVMLSHHNVIIKDLQNKYLSKFEDG